MTSHGLCENAIRLIIVYTLAFVSIQLLSVHDWQRFSAAPMLTFSASLYVCADLSGNSLNSSSFPSSLWQNTVSLWDLSLAGNSLTSLPPGLPLSLLTLNLSGERTPTLLFPRLLLLLCVCTLMTHRSYCAVL